MGIMRPSSRPSGVRPSSTRLAALSATLILQACGDGSGGPDSPAPPSTAAPPAVAVPAPAQPATLAIVAGNAQVGDVGSVLPERLRVRLRESDGRPIAGGVVSFRVGDGSGSLLNDAAVTDADGYAESGRWTLGSSAGLHRVTAHYGSVQLTFMGVATRVASPGAALPPLAVVSARDGNREIYRVDADGNNQARLTIDPGSDESPAWSADGRQLVFESDRDGSNRIYAMRADGSGVRLLTPGTEGYGPAWSPDGSSVAFGTLSDRQAAVGVLNLNNGTTSLYPLMFEWIIMTSWSPDGGKLAFVNEWDSTYFQINTIRSDGTDLRYLAGRPPGSSRSPYNQGPAWSPDGSMLAYLVGREGPNAPCDGPCPDVRFSLALMSSEGEFIKDLAWAGDIKWVDSAFPVGRLAWSPDGRGIAFTFLDCDLVTNGGCSKRRSVKYASLDGTVNRTILQDASDPAWRP